MKRLSFGVAVALACGFVLAGEKPVPVVATNDLISSWGARVTPENVWREYPRPELVRDGWQSLNGLWEYAVTGVTVAEPAKYDGRVLVPFGIGAPLSGVKRQVLPNEQIWYRRTFRAEPRDGYRTLLNFESVDYRAQVFVNGVEATDVPHAGAYVPFSVDVTDLVRAGDNELKVLAWDPTDTHLGAHGKQSVKLRTCFFPGVAGICGSVWTEQVPETYLANYRVESDVGKGTVFVSPELVGDIRHAEVTVEAAFGGKVLATGRLDRADRPVALQLPLPVRLWKMNDPALYDLTIRVSAGGRTDVVRGYFGLRTVGTRLDAHGVLRPTLNGEFVYFTGVLSQGYWSDGYVTPPSEAAARFDIDYLKDVGINAIRKHIKIEPRIFYAHCDRTGMLITQDIPSHGGDGVAATQEYGVKRYGVYRRELQEIVNHLRNHPSIVMWTAFNEGWGQPDGDRTDFAVRWLKRTDPTRLINGCSGWRDYYAGGFRGWDKIPYPPPKGKPVADVVDAHGGCINVPTIGPDRIAINGEFGGVGPSIAGHGVDPMGRPRVFVPNDGAWRAGSERHYRNLSNIVIAQVKKGLSGSFFVEDFDQFWEQGGYVTFDRAVERMSRESLRACHADIQRVARETAEGR